jgi:hypothetical protein
LNQENATSRIWKRDTYLVMVVFQMQLKKFEENNQLSVYTFIIKVNLILWAMKE